MRALRREVPAVGLEPRVVLLGRSAMTDRVGHRVRLAVRQEAAHTNRRNRARRRLRLLPIRHRLERLRLRTQDEIHR